MEHYRRGTVIIFNHYEFDNTRIENRKGTEKDVEALTEVLESLMFDVVVCHDYSYEELFEKLNEGKKIFYYNLSHVGYFANCFAVSKADHSDSDCLIVVVLSHGEEGQLYSKDYPYVPDTLWSPFSGENCPTLAGKPKIFLIQASNYYGPPYDCRM